MTFADTVRFLFSLGPEFKHVKWDLRRATALLEELGNPHRQGRFIHVAGTNGKGSTCAMIASALKAGGYRAGLYTSPHLVDPRERIQIDGEWIGEREWVTAFEDVHSVAESLLAGGVIDTHPSFFETVTVMAFVAFARSGVEAVALETGLGGRLDATNVVTPALAVITPIDFDHEAFLGSSIESIATEKAGILKPGCPAVIAPQRPEALAVLERSGVRLTHSSDWEVEDLRIDRFGSRFTLVSRDRIEIECPLAGAHQAENARTAVAALHVFGLPARAIQKGIANVVWPGRLQHWGGVILDGAHNPAGARALASYIKEFFGQEPVRMIYGAMRDKAVEEVTNILLPLAAEVILTAPRQPRAVSPEALASMVDHASVRVAPNIQEAFEMARLPSMVTFVTGSLFLIGEVLGHGPPR